MKSKIIFLFLCTFITNIYAQQPDLENKSESISTEPRVIVFNNTTRSPKKTYSNSEKNLIKLGLMNAVVGDIALYYERSLTPFFSLEGQGGVTLKNSLVYLTIYDDITTYYENPKLIEEAGLGYSYSIAAKFYPAKSSPEDFYFAPEIRNRTYNTNYKLTNTISYPEQLNITDYKLTFGYINFFEKNIFIEYHAGIGIRSRNLDFYEEILNYNNFTNFEPVYTYQKTALKLIKPTVSLNVKIGFSF